MMPEMAEFTELGDYLDIPVRTYSTGMLARLNFAVATCFSPEILLMDEWIAAGDAGFLVKARDRIESFVERAIILLETFRRWCNKAIWIERGEVKMLGEIDDILADFTREFEK
jgi:ABC-type polysaccharide/polyol phosphate transport system ATPase subunit